MHNNGWTHTIKTKLKFRSAFLDCSYWWGPLLPCKISSTGAAKARCKPRSGCCPWAAPSPCSRWVSSPSWAGHGVLWSLLHAASSFSSEPPHTSQLWPELIPLHPWRGQASFLLLLVSRNTKVPMPSRPTPHPLNSLAAVGFSSWYGRLAKLPFLLCSLVRILFSASVLPASQQALDNV